MYPKYFSCQAVGMGEVSAAERKIFLFSSKAEKVMLGEPSALLRDDDGDVVCDLMIGSETILPPSL